MKPQKPAVYNFTASFTQDPEGIAHSSAFYNIDSFPVKINI